MNAGLHEALHAWVPQGARGLDLWPVFLFACMGVFALATAVLVHALWRAPRVGAQEVHDLGAAHRPTPQRSVATRVTSAVLLLLVLVVAGMFIERALARLLLKDAVQVGVVAHPWWWAVRYRDASGPAIFETANEIHVPVGRPVVVELASDDVVHSLRVPGLLPRKDLLPGRSEVVVFQADKPGLYRGECAEFCGSAGAFMAFDVHAHEPHAYEAWRRRQQAVPPPPVQAQLQRGRSLLESACATCHAVRGTLAQGRRGPDLTHLASRRLLAAGALPNTPENLASWILDPHKHKPGVRMPAQPMPDEDLAALVAYLGSLR